MTGKGRSYRSTRKALRSPGRPPVARRAHRRKFRSAIAVGRSSEDAASDAGVSSPVGARWFRQAGGMPPSQVAPSAEPASGRYLSFAEREEIALRRVQGHGVREIARRLGRAESTLSRELRRNAATRSGCFAYRATTAQWHADRAAGRPKPAKLTTTERWRAYGQERRAGRAATGSTMGPRPERGADRASTAARLAHDKPMRVSHEAIYQSLDIQGRGAPTRPLTTCLRSGRALRMPRSRPSGRGTSVVTPEVRISERPADVADRAGRGDREGDPIIGLDRSAIGTLVERTTRFTMLLHLPPMPGHGERPRAKNGPALAGRGGEPLADPVGLRALRLRARVVVRAGSAAVSALLRSESPAKPGFEWVSIAVCWETRRSPTLSDRVWTAPAGQGLDRVPAVGRSRPCIRRLICSTVAARPDEVRRRSGPNQWRALGCAPVRTGVPIAVSPSVRHHLTSRLTVSVPAANGRRVLSCRVGPVALAGPDKRPDDPRHPVGERDRDDLHGLFLQHAPEPVVPGPAAPPRADLRHGAEVE